MLFCCLDDDSITQCDTYSSCHRTGPKHVVVRRESGDNSEPQDVQIAVPDFELPIGAERNMVKGAKVEGQVVVAIVVVTAESQCGELVRRRGDSW